LGQRQLAAKLWPSRRVLLQSENDLRELMGTRFAALEEIMNARFGAVDARLDELENRLGLVQRVTLPEAKVREIESKP